jgi:hypothetical protein
MQVSSYTDCSECRQSVQVSEFVYQYLCAGGEGEVFCSDCEQELALA